MQTILNELFDQYNRFVPDAEFLQEVENAHQQLRQSLEKPQRKLVLRIIDNKDLIASARARESFQCGFWLAWRLSTQLQSYDSGCSVGETHNVGGRFVMQEGEAEHEQTQKAISYMHRNSGTHSADSIFYPAHKARARTSTRCSSRGGIRSKR